MPRTGSSHINTLIYNCPHFVGKGELFRRHAIGNQRKFEIAALGETSSGVVTDPDSSGGWRGELPMQTLEALHRACEGRTIAFKVFPGHLPRGLIETEFLSRDDIAFAILRRRPIESFVSVVKTKGGAKYALTDTTDIKPEISADEFLEWARRMRAWYKWLREMLQAREKPYAEISFEKHLDGYSAQEALAHLRALFIPLGITNFEDLDEHAAGGTRQDREGDYRKRVANWSAFEAALRAKPMASRMLNWAQKIP